MNRCSQGLSNHEDAKKLFLRFCKLSKALTRIILYLKGNGYLNNWIYDDSSKIKKKLLQLLGLGGKNKTPAK